MSEQQGNTLSGFTFAKLKYFWVEKCEVMLWLRLLYWLSSLWRMNLSTLFFSRSVALMVNFVRVSVIYEEPMLVTEIVPSAEHAMRWPPESRALLPLRAGE